MTLHDRLCRALNRLAAGTSVIRARHIDKLAEQRNGTSREEGLEAAVEHLEAAAASLWASLEKP